MSTFQKLLLPGALLSLLTFGSPVPPLSVAGETPTGTEAKRQLAFPGAEGFGAYASGGRGGKVYRVTSLEDYARGGEPIEGTLRAAVEASGPRTVVFDVSGLIRLKDSLTVTQPNLTIAGQTAPGEGVTIKNHGLLILTHDVIVRYLRIRAGDRHFPDLGPGDEGTDAISISGSPLSTAYNVIIDHCSLTWATDENISNTRDSGGLTVQWSIIAEGLDPHSMGSIVGHNRKGVSFHHNLYASNSTRNPKIGGAILAEETEFPALIDFRNNVIYNWRTSGYSNDYLGNEALYFNYIGNYLRPGLDTSPQEARFAYRPNSDNQRFYLTGNYLEGVPEAAADNWRLVNPVHGKGVRLDGPVEVAPVYTDDAQTAFERVLREAGATLPVRDAIDERIVNDVRRGTGRIISSQDEVGGWLEAKTARAPNDSSGDGIPDRWLEKYGLDPNDPTVGNRDLNGNGYTTLEEFLNGTNPVTDWWNEKR